MNPGLAAAARVASPIPSGFHQWQGMLVDWVRSNRPDLSNRQLAVLLVVVTEPAPHTVRGLSSYLNITKPVVSRALDRLEELDYIRRMPDKADRRSILVVATKSGQDFVIDLFEDFQE